MTETSKPRRSPALLSHADYMAVRGMVPVLLERKHAAGPALERIVQSYEALSSGGFIVLQECELTRAARSGSPELRTVDHELRALDRTLKRGRRRWWRFGR